MLAKPVAFAAPVSKVNLVSSPCVIPPCVTPSVASPCDQVEADWGGWCGLWPGGA